MGFSGEDLERLERLDRLRSSGAITQEEFEVQKRLLLSRDEGQVSGPQTAVRVEADQHGASTEAQSKVGGPLIEVPPRKRPRWSKALLISVPALMIVAVSAVIALQSSGTSQPDDGTVVLAPENSKAEVVTSVAETYEWVEEGKFLFVQDSGAEFEVSVSIGEITRIRNPQEEIDSRCNLESLPEKGTAFQRIRVQVESNSNRDVLLPQFELGWAIYNPIGFWSYGSLEYSLRESQTVPGENELVPTGPLDGQSDVGLNYGYCIPTGESVDSTAQIGLGEFFIKPGEVREFNALTRLAPKVGDKERYWALLVFPNSMDPAYKENPFTSTRAFTISRFFVKNTLDIGELD